ncbi:MAG: CHAT domain-containing protein [Bacteroidota bacterium]
MRIIFILLFLTNGGWLLPALTAQYTIDQARADYRAGKEAYYDGQYHKALGLLEKALAGFENIDGPESEYVAKTCLRIGHAYRRLRRHPAALEWLERGQALAEKLEEFDEKDLASIQIDIGLVYQQMYQARKGQEYFQRSLSVYRKAYGPLSSEMGNLYMNIGLGFAKTARYRDAMGYLKKAQDIFQKSSAPESIDFNRVYNNMGYIYRKMGDYERAVNFAEKALEIKLKNYPAEHPSVPKYHRNIGRAWQEMGEYEKALPYFEKVVSLTTKVSGDSHSNTGGAYSELGNILADLGRYEEALVQYAKGIAILEKTLSPTHPYLVGGFYNIGMVQEELGNFAEAQRLYQKVLDRFEQSDESPPQAIADALTQQARIKMKLGRAEEGLLLLNKAQEKLVLQEGYRLPSVYGNPPLEKIQAKLEYLRLLRVKSECLLQLAASASDLLPLRAAMACIENAIELVDQMRNSYPSEDSRQRLNGEVADLYKMAIEQTYELYERTDSTHYLHRAVELSSQSKASIFRQHLNEQAARNLAGFSAEDKAQLEVLETQLQEAREQMTERPNTAQARKMREAELAYQEAISRLENRYPNYRKLKFRLAPLNIDQFIQQWISPNTALVEYFYSDDHLFTFLLTPTGLISRRQKIDSLFQQSIQQLRQAELANLLTQNQSAEEYQQAIYHLYDLLIAPIRSELNPAKELVIIPHGQLQYLSFEMLAARSGLTDFRQLPYLLRDFSIRYAWSMDAMTQEQDYLSEQATYAINLLGVSPDFPEVTDAKEFRFQPQALLYNRQEVEQAAGTMGGELLVGEEASKTAFLEKAANSKILHLATHGLADDQQPSQSGLYFAETEDSLDNHYLNALEIYGLQLSAELAVISACNTAYGKLAEGEGVMSLGRAFTYAGCKSTMTSLWLANDQSTSKLMQLFYRHLQNGQYKHVALRQAKLDYLANADALSAHPYFWAGIIASGNMRPLESSTNAWLDWRLLGIGLIVLWWLFSKIKDKFIQRKSKKQRL